MLRVLRTILLGLIATVVAVAFPAEGLASCGDWLADSSESMVEHSNNGSEAQVELITLPLQPASPLPCTGPECRQQPSTPLQPTPVEVVVNTNQALLLKLNRPSLSLSQQQHGRSSNDSPLTGFADSLERPPQG